MNLKISSALSLLFTLVLIQKCFATESASEIAVSPLSIGEQLTFKSTVLNENRTLNVYLPASYKKSDDKRYPVIYLLDGAIDEDFIHVSGIVQFASFPWLKFVPESIVVGIVNVDRKRDFTFESSDPLDVKEFPTSGGAASFIKFLDAEVQPLVNKQYRTNQQSTLIGQSLGGLLATKILLDSPNLFNNYLIVSPSLWWNKESLLSHPVTVSEGNLNIYIGVGGEGSTMIRLAASLSDKLNQAYKNKNATSFKYFEELNHGDALHLATYEGLKSIFSENADTEKPSE